MARSLPLGIGAALVAISFVAAAATTNEARWPSEGRFIAWIGFLMLSFWGWGSLAAHAFRAESIRGFVRIALGMAALLTVAGLFLAAHLLGFVVLAGLLIVGATVQLWSFLDSGAQLAARFRRSSPAERRSLLTITPAALGSLGYTLAAAVVLAVAFLRLLDSAKLTLPWWDADDTPAYWAFIRELTQRGSFDQAFSFRRLAAFGGQTVLQAITALGVPIRSINVFDAGICPLLMTGILLQVGYGQWLGIAAGLLVAFLPTAAFNSGSNFSGALLLVVVYFALRLASDGSARRSALVGMTVAALCTLRHSFIPGCAVLLATASLVHFASPEARPWRQRTSFVVAVAIAFAVSIAPWSLASLIASDTPLFPLFHGTYRGGGLDLGGDSAKWLDGLKGILDEPNKTPQLLVVFAAILALGSRLSRAALIPLALGTLACTVLLARTAPFNPSDDARYLAAPWLGLLVAFYCEAARALRDPASATSDPLLVAGVATVLVALQLAPSLSPGIAAIADNDRTRADWPVWEGEKDLRAAALDLQAHVPPGRALLVACDQEYHFDFRRNKIVLIDLPTVASPFPLPGENATPEQYEKAISEFHRLGIDYLLFSDPDRSRTMYSGPRWESFRHDGYRTHELLVPRFAAWFAFERYVATHRRIVAASGNEVLAELGSAAGS